MVYLFLCFFPPVPSCAKTGYDLYPESQAQDQSPKCQKFVQLCDPYGDYTCCDGLDCFFPQGVSGVGLCLPLPHPLKQGDTNHNHISIYGYTFQVFEKKGKYSA